MLTFNIQHQEQYSRGELLLRSFFGIFYMALPHIIVMYFYMIYVFILTFVAWWVILFTGKTPEFYYQATLKLNRWSTRLSARMMNLCDGYPAIGPNGSDDKTQVDFPLIHVGRGQLLLRSFFGWIYVGIPHGFMLYFRYIGAMFVTIAAWFVVLFTGKYPANWHSFVTGTYRWGMRVSLYLSFLYEQYPPFSGKPDQPEAGEQPIDQVA